jgi:FemAB-related protein (PEP-CTERM system-associated)
MRPEASIYLMSGWALLAREVFGHRVFFVEGRDAAGTLCGVLPVVQQKSLLLGNFATSLPFFNYGGALCENVSLAQLMMERARELAEGLGCSYLEFRDTVQWPGEWIVRTDKVGMLLELPESLTALSQQLGSKLRSQVKRAERENPTVRTGGKELVEDFYGVFARNMRDLGTPVYPRKFFRALVEKFPELCQLLVLDCRGAPAAAAFLIIAGGRAEIPWAACSAEARPWGGNMKLYWEVLSLVSERGCRLFDFGRSTLGAGTYNFKKQWGAKPVPLYWHRWERRPAKKGHTAPAADGRIMRYATAMWQRLPLRIANAVGPLVSPGLPW